MTCSVELTDDASRDLEDLFDFIVTHDSPERARDVITALRDLVVSLAEFPDRGNHPPELRELGILEYREVFFRSWRVIYRRIGETVYVYVIADGRRDMQTLLMRRLLTR